MKRHLETPLYLVGGGVITLIAAYFYRKEIAQATVKYTDEIANKIFTTKTGYKKIDAILDKLQKASAESGIPLGLMIGWIAKESGGRIGDLTKLDERGYFQLHPDESKALGLDHQRLSTDPDYSIAGGVALIKKYMGRVDGLGVAPKGSEYYWKVVKLFHTMGSGAAAKIVKMASAAGAVSSWESLEKYALDNETELFRIVKHSPTKWFPLVDKVYATGKDFGFETRGAA